MSGQLPGALRQGRLFSRTTIPVPPHPLVTAPPSSPPPPPLALATVCRDRVSVSQLLLKDAIGDLNDLLSGDTTDKLRKTIRCVGLWDPDYCKYLKRIKLKAGP